MPIPTYEEARALLNEASRDLALAHEATDQFHRDWRYRKAFDALFGAVRYAAMAFLSTENTRWGELPRQLPHAFSERFRKFIGTLHVRYHYDGLYPKDTADEEFARWRDAVSQFIDDLEEAAATPAEAGQPENGDEAD